MFPFCDFNNLIKTLFFSDPKMKKKMEKEKFVVVVLIVALKERARVVWATRAKTRQIHKRRLNRIYY